MLLFAGTADLVVPAVVDAQNLFGDSGFSSSHGSYSSAPYEHIDPLSGNLIVVVNDLSLPGNAGLDLHVTRSYNSKFHRDFEHGDLALDERTPLGVGWRLHFGRVLHDDSNQPGDTIIETPDGGGQPLYQSIGHGWMTKSFWRYDRATSTAYLPNGLIYVFGHIGETSGPRGRVRYVTEIRDPFNNRITFEYNGNGSLPGSIWRIRQHLGPTQIREVLFNYHGNGSLDRMVYDGREWVFEYDVAPGWSSEWVLRRVVLRTGPLQVGLPWEYVYGNSGVGPELTGLRPPGGGTMDYVYATVTRQASTLIQPSRVVQSRVTGGFRVTPGTWTFSYNQGPDADTTIVDCPCNKTTYRFAGVGPYGDFSAWKSGLLLERNVYEPGPSGALLETEAFTYERGEPISNDAIPGQSGIWADTAVYPALVSWSSLARGSNPWVTINYYRSGLGNYNDFGRPWWTQHYGDETRTIERVFNYNVAGWIVDRTASSSVTSSWTPEHPSETRTSSWNYDLATGFLTQSNVFGFVTAYASNAAGQVASVTNANNHTTTFTYDWGVLKKTTTPLLTTERVINQDGTVASETMGTLSTQYQYDLAFRLKTVRPPSWPAVTSIDYEYDNVTSYFVREARGTSQTEQTLDGFGRVVETSNQVGVKTRVERDACGRVTHRSLPFTNINNAVYTATTYDALGRVKTVTAPGTPASVTTYSYNRLNVVVTDAEGRSTEYKYDGLSGPGDVRLRSVRDADQNDTKYTYDVLGNLTRVEGPGPAPPRTWTYNQRGELQSETQPESGTNSYVYDPAGNIKQVTNAVGQVTTLQYDANERVIQRTSNSGTASNVTIAYDALGRVQQQTIEGVVTTFGYDAAGRPASRTDGIHPGMTFTSQYLYDANDNLSTIVYPSGRQVTYQYDNEFRLKDVTNNGGTLPRFADTFLYDESGRLKSYVTGAVTHSVGYDARSRVEQLVAGVPGLPQMHLTYGYDKVSNVRSIADARIGAPQPTQTFTYDVLNRMETANGPWGGISWDYDAAGNRLWEMRGSTTTYGYDPATNRLTSTGGANPETFTWNAKGELQANLRGGAMHSYSYSPAGMMLTATAPNIAASYLYDADHLRVKREVNGVTHVTVRSFGGQVLSEYQSCSGGPQVWTRDNVYAGSRLLGALRRSAAEPTVSFEATSNAYAEASINAEFAVILTTPDGNPLPCQLTVSYQTEAGSAIPGGDYQTASGSIIFPAGAPNGQRRTAPLTLVNDTMSEPSQFLRVNLTGASGGQVGSLATHVLWIQDEDPLPTLTVANANNPGNPNDPGVPETAGYANFKLSLSQATEHTVSVNVDAANGTAREYWDYHDIALFVIFDPLTVDRTIGVPIIDDARAEPAETLEIQVWNPINVTIANNVRGATIVDNERPRAPIDLSLPGQFMALGTAFSTYPDYIAIGNRYGVTVPARVTFTRGDGSGISHDFDVPANGRITISPQNYAPSLGNEDVAIAVQSRDVNYALDAEHAVYTTWSGWESGRATEGVTPSPTWYFAEGSVGYFEEIFTIFNPTNAPVDVNAIYYGPSGVVGQATHHIEEGPGWTKFFVRDVIGTGDHGTRLEARNLAGALVPIVVERDMSWQAGGAYLDENSAPGVPASQPAWYFAEGDTGIETFLTVLNPNLTVETLEIRYLHENGTTYTTNASIGAQSRLTIATPAWLPAGSFGMRVGTFSGQPIVAERSMYGGTNWTFGHAGIGASAPATLWAFTEGATGTFWTTYFLLANPGSVQATVTLAFTRTDGLVYAHSVTVPAGSRRTVPVNAVAGMADAVFRTVITSSQPVVVERATYWPTGGGSLMSASADADAASEANAAAIDRADAAESREAGGGAERLAPELRTITFNPYGRPRPRLKLPPFYHATITGEPAGDAERALAARFELDELIRATQGTGRTLDAESGEESLSFSGGWYGAHLTGGRRP